MKISRVWAMANKWTFTIKPINELITRYMADTRPWIDPFAGMYSPADIRNDINPRANADYNLDAQEFMKLWNNETVMGVLYDPPYSTRQIEEVYNGHGLENNPTLTSYSSVMKQEINRVLKPGGLVISFGWNSNGCSIYKDRAKRFNQLDKIEVLLVAHGMDKHDTICTIERKIQGALELK